MAWYALAQLEINAGDPFCVNEGEQWQYMGTVKKNQTLHQFRHRNHPRTNTYEYAHIVL